MTDPMPADLNISPVRRRFWRNLSYIWLVPLAALVVSVFIAWQSYASRGTLVYISFVNAAGIKEGETTVRYRDVTIGTVESIEFTADLANVIVGARIDTPVADTLARDTKFWVVRPEVSTRGISGLSTVLSGVYIDAYWQPSDNNRSRRFTALESAPPSPLGQQGTVVTIRAREGTNLTAGSPVSFKGIEVGSIRAPRLSESGTGVVVEAFVQSPYDRRITTSTRFWDTSGFAVNFGPAGVDLKVGSLASLISGGIGFDNVVSGGEPVTPTDRFDLFPDEDSARASVFVLVGEDALRFQLRFSESVSGLSVGAPVQYRGLRVGQVESIGAIVVDTPAGQSVQLRAVIAVSPEALGLPPDSGTDAAMSFLENAVMDGLRGELSAASIFNTSLQIELRQEPDAPPARIEPVADGLPIFPTLYSELPDFAATAEGLIERINALPVEELMTQAIETLAAVESLAMDEDLRAVPGATTDLLNEARAFVGSDATQAIPAELQATLADLRAVVSDLRTSGAIDRLNSAMASADLAAANIATASEQFPELVASLQAFADKGNALKAEDLVASATQVMDSANALIDSDETRAIPPALTNALNEVQAALQALREGGAVENVNATLASTRDAAESVAAAVEGLPQLSARLEQLVAQTEGLIAGYGTRSDFNRETLDALREVSDAAKAVAQLARTIERNPNSLLTGR